MMTNTTKQLVAMKCIATVVVSLMCAPTVWANAPVEAYLSESDYPDFAVLFSPPGREDALFFYDLCQHAHALSLWGTQRAIEAQQDSAWDIGVAKRFEQAFGQEISLETNAELYVLLERTAMDVSISLRFIKQKYHRVRPYVYFGEGTLIPDDEEALRENGSFPSGHSAVGYAFALILAELAPQRQTAILKRGIEYGDSRVIANYHWQSGVDAGRIIASMVVAKLHSCKSFREQLERARSRHGTMSQSQAVSN